MFDRLLPRAVHRQVADDILGGCPVVERGLGERPDEPLRLAGELVQLHLEPAKVRFWSLDLRSLRNPHAIFAG
jgi:hypothetical protein